MKSFAPFGYSLLCKSMLAVSLMPFVNGGSIGNVIFAINGTARVLAASPRGQVVVKAMYRFGKERCYLLDVSSPKSSPIEIPGMRTVPANGLTDGDLRWEDQRGYLRESTLAGLRKDPEGRVISRVGEDTYWVAASGSGSAGLYVSGPPARRQAYLRMGTTGSKILPLPHTASWLSVDPSGHYLVCQDGDWGEVTTLQGKALARSRIAVQDVHWRLGAGPSSQVCVTSNDNRAVLFQGTGKAWKAEKLANTVAVDMEHYVLIELLPDGTVQVVSPAGAKASLGSLNGMWSDLKVCPEKRIAVYGYEDGTIRAFHY